MPVIPPHEWFCERLGPDKPERLAEAIAADSLPPSYFDSEVITEAPPGTPVYPVAIYVDGVGYSETDTVVGFWIVDIHPHERALSRVCAP